MLAELRGSGRKSALLLLHVFVIGCADERQLAVMSAAQEASADGGEPSAPLNSEPADAVPGAVAGTTVWRFPATPNGLAPNQSWLSLGAAPDGSIFATASDAKTNSALYRVDPSDDRLTYVGDARTASEKASNWRPGETAEKFHVPLLWYQGRGYIATDDYSLQDDGYLAHRGFHWYGYDAARGFVDLSVHEPSGVAAEHISVYATGVDESRGYLYALGSPTAHLYRYDIAAGTTVDLGRPPELTRQYYNPGRFLWVDRNGTVYFTVGHSGPIPPANEPETPKYVLSYHPDKGWVSHTDWKIAEMLRMGQWSRDRKRLYVIDYPLNLYRFDEETQNFTQIGVGKLGPQHVSPRTQGIRVRSAHLSASERKLYFVNDTAPESALWEWEFATGAPPRELTTVPAIAARLDARYTAFTGHDAWDGAGRFFFTGFGGEGVPPTPDVSLIRVDPVRLKASLGLLPGVAQLALEEVGGTQVLVRSGDTSSELTVLLARAGQTTPLPSVTLPAGATRLPLAPGAQKVSLVPDGDTYVVR